MISVRHGNEYYQLQQMSCQNISSTLPRIYVIVQNKHIKEQQKHFNVSLIDKKTLV